MGTYQHSSISSTCAHRAPSSCCIFDASVQVRTTHCAYKNCAKHMTNGKPVHISSSTEQHNSMWLLFVRMVRFLFQSNDFINPTEWDRLAAHRAINMKSIWAWFEWKLLSIKNYETHYSNVCVCEKKKNDNEIMWRWVWIIGKICSHTSAKVPILLT